MQLLHPRYLHVLHKCASLLGGYEEENVDVGLLSALGLKQGLWIIRICYTPYNIRQP